MALSVLKGITKLRVSIENLHFFSTSDPSIQLLHNDNDIFIDLHKACCVLLKTYFLFLKEIIVWKLRISLKYEIVNEH